MAEELKFQIVIGGEPAAEEVIDALNASINRISESIGMIGPAEREWNKQIWDVRTSIIEQRDALVLRKEALDDPVTQRAIKEARQLQEEIHGLTREIKAETSLLPDVQSLTDAMGRQTAEMRARITAMSSVEGQSYLKEQAAIKKELNAVTAATRLVNDEEKLTVSQRRELMVMLHEASQGNFKNLIGSAMVLEEGEGGALGAIKAATKAVTESIGPFGLAAGAIAITGVAAFELREHFIKLSETEAENYHKMEQLGERVGMTAEDMRGLEYATLNTGTNAEKVAQAIAMFSVRLEEHRQTFAALGVTAKEPVAAFEQLIDAANRAGTESERNRILQEGLGRGWQALIPIIEKGGAALEEAIQKGKLPADVKADYESIINYQKLMKQAEWEADQASAEHASHMAADAAKMSAAAAMMKSAHGAILGTLMNWAELAAAGMTEGDHKTSGELMVEDAMKKQAADAAKKPLPGIQGPSEAQRKALEESHKKVSKESLESEIAQNHEDFQKLMNEFKIDSDGYNTIKEDRRKKDEELTEKWNRAHRDRAGISEAKKIAAHNEKSKEFVETNFDNSVTLRSGIKYDTGTDPEYIKDRERADKMLETRAKEKRTLLAEEQKYGIELLASQKQTASQILMDDEKEHSYSFALQMDAKQKRLASDAAFDAKEAAAKKEQARSVFDAEIAEGKSRELAELTLSHKIDKIDSDMARAKILRDREILEAKKAHWREYADVAQSYGSKEVADILKGQFTITGAYNAAKDAAINMFAEKTTKYIEGAIEESIFGKATAASNAAMMTATMAEIAAASVPAAAGVSIATSGGADAAASAAGTATYATFAGLALAGHAKGGTQFSGWAMRHESGPEMAHAVVPTQVYQASHTHTSTTNAPITIHIHGGDTNSILRTIRNATTNGAGTSH